jgi:hypothetical protein
MSETLEGGCNCGAIRYSIKLGFRLRLYACHCTDCQTRTGSAFGLQLAVMPHDMEVSGTSITGSRTQPSGAKVQFHACGTCLTQLYATSDSNPLAAIRAGTLDDSASLSPAAHFWVKSKQPWVVIPDGVPALETQPQSAEEWMKLLGPQT